MKWLIYIMILFTSAIWFSSCRSIQHIPIETVKHDSIYISKILHDSIYQRDSIYVDRKGDTVLIYKDRYVYKYKNLVDTFYIHKVIVYKCLIRLRKVYHDGKLLKWSLADGDSE